MYNGEGDEYARIEPLDFRGQRRRSAAAVKQHRQPRLRGDRIIEARPD